MIVHIGWDACVQDESIIAILNKATALGGQAAGGNATQRYIAAEKRAGRFHESPEGEKAYVLAEESGHTHVYASAINAVTLMKRIQSGE